MRYLGGTTRALAPITAVCLALTLAACTSTPTANPTRPAVSSSPSPPAPPPAPTPTPEPSPTSTAELPDVTVAPAPPAALDGPPTEENAAAVAEYYVSLYPYLRATGDSAQWAELAGPSCGYCAGILDDLRGMVARGERTVDGAIEIESSGAKTVDGDQYIAWVVMYEHRSHAVDDAGEIVEEFPAEVRFRVDMDLTWQGSRWRVDAVNANRLAR